MELPGFARTYHVSLFARNPIRADKEKLLEQLRQHCGRVLEMGKEETSYLYAFEDHLVQYRDGQMPAQAGLIFLSDRKPNKSAYMQAIQQSRFWPEAGDILDECNYTVGLHDIVASGLPYQERLQLFHGVLESVLTVADCDAIFWRHSEQFTSPNEYLKIRGSDVANSPTGQLLGPLNVRFFNIQTPDGSTSMLMDTLGLAALGLPDVQCQFVDLDPNAVARLLYNTGAYLFERGDIINDGETVAGINPTDKWKCQHEAALVPPEREVLDINPGHPFAAGLRD